MPRKFSFKLFSSFVSIVLIGGLLTSCGASEEELALKANCDKIFANLQKIGERPEVFRNSDTADDDYLSLLFGPESRKNAERKILAKYPFLDEIIVAREKGNQYPDAYYYAGSIFIIADALKGTDIEFPYSREEMLSIATQENGWRKVVDPLAKEIFGDHMDPINYPGCVVVDQAREEENPDDYLSNFETNTEFFRASNDYVDLAGFLQVIRNCEMTGWHWTEKCAKVDYVSKPSTYTPSDELTEEEKEILAERERDSQDSSGSTVYSDVTPLQLCGSLGAVVQTENYGQLTCKYVLINRIRTLAWMR